MGSGDVTVTLHPSSQDSFHIAVDAAAERDSVTAASSFKVRRSTAVMAGRQDSSACMGGDRSINTLVGKLEWHRL